MKIIQINSVYEFGSTGKITHDLHHAMLDKGYNSIVYYGRRNDTTDKGVFRLCSEYYGKFNSFLSRLSGIMYGGCRLSTSRLISHIKKEKPDLIHLQCINGYFVNIYRIIKFLNKNNIPTVLTLHAEFMYTANCSHAFDCQKWKTGCGDCHRYKQVTKSLLFDRTASSWRLLSNAYVGFENIVIVSVSKWLQDRAKESPMLADKHHVVIHNGIDTNLFKLYSKNDLDEMRRIMGIQLEKKIILHVTPSFSPNPQSLKGGFFFLELAKKCSNDDYCFVVVGPYDKSFDYPENVIMLGAIRNKEQLAKIYSLANVTVLTSKRETFSMVCAESLCCGTPVIGFKAGGPEQIAIKEYSYFCEYGDVYKMKEKLAEYMLKKNEQIAVEAKREYSKNRMITEYEKLYYDITRGKH